MTQEIAIYVHWPFCESKCPYCDFNSHVSNDIDVDEWKKAYLNEIDKFQDIISKKHIRSIFFGGGTPSLMPADIIEKIINALGNIAYISDDTEITMEANPASSTLSKFQEFKTAGINRLSIGIQSFDTQNLKFLGRKHSSNDAIQTIENALKIFDNMSFDLMYGLPNQQLDSWIEELNHAMHYQTNHISLYQLKIEKGTPFYKAYNKGEFILPSDDLAAELYLVTNKKLYENGYNLYEVSNYAKEGYESKHNLTYWEYKDYLGIGPGAHSRMGTNTDTPHEKIMIYNPKNWLQKALEKDITHQKNNYINKREKIIEMVMMGLRIIKGIEISRFIDEKLLFAKMQQMNKENYLVIRDGFVQIHPEKILLTDAITAKLLESL